MNRAPSNLVTVHFAATHLSDVCEPFGKCSIDQREYRAPPSAPDAGFHHPRCRGCGYINRPIRLKNVFESCLQPREQVFELGAPMRDHRSSHCLENLRPHFGWSRNEERAKRALDICHRSIHCFHVTSSSPIETLLELLT